MDVRIYYKHTDCGGITYHSNYIDFCEMARSELFFQAGISPTVNGCHFALKYISCDFQKFSKLGDTLTIYSKLKELKNVSFVIEHAIKRGDELIFTMEATLVFLCQSGKIGIIPDEYREFLENLDQ